MSSNSCNDSAQVSHAGSFGLAQQYRTGDAFMLTALGLYAWATLMSAAAWRHAITRNSMIARARPL
ncbi:MAG: hypothetical protein M0R28_09680 [Pigmentiphaga sp.]|nr:hypothetical protein [Pigmentiphaga sp.]